MHRCGVAPLALPEGRFSKREDLRKLDVVDEVDDEDDTHMALEQLRMQPRVADGFHRQQGTVGEMKFSVRNMEHWLFHM